MLSGSRLFRSAFAAALVSIATLANNSMADVVFSWGSNAYGKLGDGTSTNRLSPTLTTGLSGVNIVAVSAGGNTSMALDSAGQVWGWGGNNSKQLADGSSSSTFDFANHPTPTVLAALPTSNAVTSLASGYGSVTAIRGGSLYGWGANNVGNLGIGNTNSTVSTPTENPVLNAGVTKVGRGFNGGFAVQGGALYGWGSNTQGQVGNGTTTQQNTPVAVANMTSGVTAAEGGQSFALGIKDGGVYAWGLNSLGALGNGTSVNSTTPVAALGLGSGATDIAAGSAHSMALVNGTVYAWGYNNYGQVGNGTTTNVTTPTAVAGIVGTIVDIAANDYSSYALTSDGDLWVWGNNAVGQLGLGDTTSRLTPTLLTAPAGYAFTSISSGLSNSNTSDFILATAVSVPEPALAMAVAAGFGALGLRRRSAPKA